MRKIVAAGAAVLALAGCGSSGPGKPPSPPSAMTIAHYIPGCAGSNTLSETPDLYARQTASCSGSAFPSGVTVETFTSGANLLRWMAGSTNDLQTMLHGHLWAVEPVGQGEVPGIQRALARHGLRGTWTSNNNCC